MQALHTSLECLALGMMAARADFYILFTAIASHKVVSALALSSRFLKEGASTRQVLAYVGPFCAVAPVSVLAGMYLRTMGALVQLVLNCFATGKQASKQTSTLMACQLTCAAQAALARSLVELRRQRTWAPPPPPRSPGSAPGRVWRCQATMLTPALLGTACALRPECVRRRA